MEEDWVFLIEAFNDVEADIICGFLQSAGIHARKEDSDSLMGAMRVITGQAMEVHVQVPRKMLEQAQELIRTLDKTEGLDEDQ